MGWNSFQLLPYEVSTLARKRVDFLYEPREERGAAGWLPGLPGYSNWSALRLPSTAVVTMKYVTVRRRAQPALTGLQ